MEGLACPKCGGILVWWDVAGDFVCKLGHLFWTNQTEETKSAQDRLSKEYESTVSLLSVLRKA